MPPKYLFSLSELIRRISADHGYVVPGWDASKHAFCEFCT